MDLPTETSNGAGAGGPWSRTFRRYLLREGGKENLDPLLDKSQPVVSLAPHHPYADQFTGVRSTHVLQRPFGI